MKNATTIKSYRVTLGAVSERIRAVRAQDALASIAGKVYGSRWRQEGSLKKGRAVLWVRGIGKRVLAKVVRIVPKQPMGAPVRDPRPAKRPVPMKVDASFARLAAEEKAARELRAQVEAARAENARLKGMKTTAYYELEPEPAEEKAALLAEIARYRAENAALKGEARKPAASKPAARPQKARRSLADKVIAAVKGPKDDAALLAEIARYRAENAALRAAA